MAALVALFLLLQDEAELRRHVEALSSDAMEGRCTGTPGAERAVEYIARAFEKCGLRAPTGGYVQEFEIPGLSGSRRALVGKNVVGIVEGTSRRGEFVLIGAHYDGPGRKGDPNPPARMPGDRNDPIWNGADDNASGVAAMLEIARLSAASPPARSLVFVAFGAEEFDSLGAAHFLKAPPVGAIVAMANLHMLGRNPDRALEILGADSGEEWAEICLAIAKDARVVMQSPRNGDQSMFAGARIPAVTLFGGFHEDYHAPSDEASKISWSALVARTGFARKLATELATRAGRIRWRRPSWAGQLGIQGTDITDEEAERLGVPGGVRVAEVADGTPAAEAGVRVEDVILEFGGRKLTRDGAKAELLKAIQSLRPGDEADLIVLRDGRRVTLRVRWPGR